MADEPSTSTRRVSFVLSRNFESRRADGASLDKTQLGTISLAFYVARTPLTGQNTYETTRDGKSGELIQSEYSEPNIIVEYQQEILLDEKSAQDLRDNLNELFGKAEP